MKDDSCEFCHGTGLAKYIDFVELNDVVPNGSYNWNEFFDKYGEWGECPNGCKPIVN